MAILEIIDAKCPVSIIKEASILDVISGKILPACDIKIQGGRIVETGAGLSANGAREIPAAGLTLVPGLIDCHSHILSPFLTSQKNNIVAPWVFRQIGRNLAANLSSGVVAVRDMLSPIRIMNKVRALISRGYVHGPDIYASGAILSCKGGYPEFIIPIKGALGAIIGSPKYEFDSPDQAKKIIKLLHASGANHIKVGYSSRNRENEGPDTMPTISFEALDAICREAHALGLIVSAHHNWSDDIPRLLRADVDTLEHQPSDMIISDEHIALLLKKKVRVVPTMAVSHSMSYFDKKTEFFNTQASREMFEPEAHKLLSFITSTWLDMNEKSYHEVFGFWRGNRESYERNVETVKRMHKAGVPLLTGTDFGAVVAFAGELTEEVMRFTTFGMSNAEAIRSATSEAAKLLGAQNDLGSVEPGKKASMFLVKGNPLEDISTLKNVSMVVKDGRWYRRAGDTESSLWNKDYSFQ